MSTTFRPYLPEQSLLLPPDVREWLRRGPLAGIRLGVRSPVASRVIDLSLQAVVLTPQAFVAALQAFVLVSQARVVALAPRPLSAPPFLLPLEFSVRRSRATPAARARQGGRILSIWSVSDWDGR